MDFKTIANTDILTLKPYQPGKPIAELERELGITDIIKLASNESPIGPSPRAISAAKQAADSLRYYPDSNGYVLKQALAKHLTLASEQIILGNGSDAILHLVAQTFLNPGEEIIISQYAFATFEIIARSYNGKPVIIPAKHFAHDLSAMSAAITSQTKLIYLANPNNPTGTWFTHTALENFLKKIPPQVLVIADEAYYEYMDNPDYPQSLALQQLHPNLIITRTFSKAYGLAGLRVGYGIAHPQIIELLNRVRTPFNVSSPAQEAAAVALEDKAHLAKVFQINKMGLTQLRSGINALKFAIISEVGNFLTIDFRMPATPLYRKLLEHGIIVRPLANYGLENYLRVTVGLPEENKRFLTTLEKVLRSHL